MSGARGQDLWTAGYGSATSGLLYLGGDSVYSPTMSFALSDPAPSLDAIRARFRGLGLVETATGTSWFYAAPDTPHRLLLVLQAVGRGMQIYLYPRALGRAPGAAQWFYATLEEAGFGMGSKLGPSISLPVDDGERMALFWDRFALLLAGGSLIEAASR